MDKKNFVSSMSYRQLQNGVVWPIPLSLPITPKVAKLAEKSGNVSIRDKEGRLLGILRVSDIFSMQSSKVAKKLNDGSAPTKRNQEIIYAGGEIEAVQDVTYYTHLDKRCIYIFSFKSHIFFLFPYFFFIFLSFYLSFFSHLTIKY